MIELSEIDKKLIEGISRYPHYEYSIEKALMDSSKFRQSRGVHQWDDYVPDKVREIWNELPFQSRLIIFLMAEELASKEEWD